jgi:hypothetical protein
MGEAGGRREVRDNPDGWVPPVGERVREGGEGGPAGKQNGPASDLGQRPAGLERRLGRRRRKEKKRKEKDRWAVGLEEEMVRVWFCFFFFFLETLFKLFSNTNF